MSNKSISHGMEFLRSFSRLRSLVRKSPFLCICIILFHRLLQLLGGRDEISHLGKSACIHMLHSVYPSLLMPNQDHALGRDAAFQGQFRHLAPFRDVLRPYNLDQLVQLAVRVDGDFAECGCYQGASAYFMARHILQKSLSKRLCLFDSFQGISDPGSMDGHYWSGGDLSASEEELRHTLESLGEELPFLEIYSGWIPERFEEIAERKFSFVHIDVDLYAPTRDSLNFFYPRMSQGGVVLFDDYGLGSCPGTTKAVDEFIRDKPEPIVNLAAGGAFVIKS